MINELNFPEVKQLKALKLKPNQLKFEFFEGPIPAEYTEKSIQEYDFVPATIRSNRYLSDTVVEMVLDSGLEFELGDAIGVIPTNNENLVDELMAYLKYPNEFFKATGTKVPNHLHCHSLVKNALLIIDLNTFPTKSYFRGLAEFASGTFKEKLLILSSVTGKVVFQQLQQHRLNLLELFQLFEIKPNIEFLLEHTPPIKSRYYSCSQLSKDFTFAFTVVEKGLCTNWLLNICKECTPFNVYLRKAPIKFTLPIEGSPIMICNGTGVAPFIAFIQKLANERRNGTLLYGHRTSKDSIYMELIDEHKGNGTVDIIECLSRENSEFKYVQDALHKIEGIFTRPILVCG
jgi:sulfite reductase (NADPH) flavoprotein alpha-component